jgi:hypothetical protein
MKHQGQLQFFQDYPKANGWLLRSSCRLLLVLILIFFCPASVLACRYNVRDIGFIDVEPECYRLQFLVAPETPEDVLALLRHLPAEFLSNCNVHCEVLDANASANVYAARGQLPGAVLLSPNGQALQLPLSRTGRSFRESLVSALEEVAVSAAREELIATASRAFAAVFLIEGQSARANEQARRSISSAIQEIRVQMQSMPKTIAAPPELVVLEASALARERVLLWSLGLDTAQTDQPRVMVIYGRARWIGPLMNGDEISEHNLTRLLSIIGADCECGLDVAWTLGTRLPVRWDDTRHAQLVKTLGFDPENPLVRAEVARIVGRSSSLHTPSLSYQEVVLATDPLPAPASPPDRLQAAPTQRADAQIKGRTNSPPVTASLHAPLFNTALLFLLVLTLCVVIGALLILWRARPGPFQGDKDRSSPGK